VQRKPTWGTCAGLILLSDQANATKRGGQDLIGGLAVRVHRNHFGRQIESFEAGLDLPFLGAADPAASTDMSPFPGVFIRAPVVEEVLHLHGPVTSSSSSAAAAAEVKTDGREDGQGVEILAKLPGRVDRMKAGMSQAAVRDDSGDVVAVQQGNIVGTSFHPELTTDARIHVWWLQEILRARS
jgi:5'-phosphate synthase pdxT subunit